MQLNSKRESLAQASGQGMVEYIIIVALIALAAIGAFSFFGKAVRSQTAQMANQVAGGSTDTGRQQANAAATSAAAEATAAAGLNDYEQRDKK